MGIQHLTSGSGKKQADLITQERIAGALLREPDLPDLDCS